MIYIFLLVYLFIIIIPFKKKDENKSFSPVILFVLITSFNSIPFILGCLIDKYSFIDSRVIKVIGDNFELSLSKFLFIQIIGILFYYFGYYKKRKFNIKIKNFIVVNSKKTNLTLFFLLFFSLMITSVFFIDSIGSLYYIFSNFMYANQFLEGKYFFITLINFCALFSMIFLIRYFSFNKKINYLILLLLFPIYFIALTLTGGRTPFILFFFQFLISYNYYIKKINLANIKLLPAYIFLVIFIIIIPQLRSISGLDINIEKVILNNFASLINGNEYINIQLLIQNYFDFDNFWFGKSFLDLFFAFIPRSMYINKPPIDEGVYFFNILNGIQIIPPIPYGNLLSNSWPPSTLGNMYANFGILGVCFGFFLLGSLHSYLKAFIYQHNFSPFAIFIYSFVVVKFQFTNYYIFNLVVNIIMVYTLAMFIKWFIVIFVQKARV
ncbi:MAG: oligosaccharide repeat unit polymerase [Ignavibacteriae bacterium]|nr:oligosaccharide repeat unit polymerase [Ignavibacteriota bacterium]